MESLEASPASSSPAPASPPPADLLALARSTDQELAPPAAGAAAAAALPKLPLEQELAGMFAMIGAGAGHWLPSVGVVLDDKSCKELGDVLAPVARKYDLARYLEGFAWRIELQALLVAVPIGLALNAAAKHDLAAIAAAQRAAAAGDASPLGLSSPGPNLTGQALPDTRGMLQPIDTSAPAAAVEASP